MMKNAKNNLKNYFSNGPKTVFVVVLLLTCITVTIFNMKKTISVVVDGKSMEVTTLKSNVTQILKTNDIALGPKDQITVSLDSKVKDGDKIYIKKAVEVKVIVENQINEFDVAFAEEIILGISSKELSAITWLGALLGAIMGLLSPILGSL